MAGSTVGGILAAGAVERSDPRFVSLGDAHKGTLEIDLKIMNQFGDQPKEVLDFYTACREALTGDNPDKDVPATCQKFNRPTLGGPMLGDIHSTSVSVWMHLVKPGVVRVEVTPESGGKAIVFESNDAEPVLSVRCDGLAADTAYRYQVTDADKQSLGKGSFVTPPEEFSEKPFRITFGADFHKIGMYRPELMKLIRERNSRAMLLIGDSAVDGRKDNYGLINTDYLLRNLSPSIQDLTAHVPVSATWDDHDYWGNDTSGTQTNSKKPIDVDGLRAMWKRQWNNPERDVEREGIYFQTQIGPVHYIALDTRSCRINADRGEANCFLGEAQMKWLEEQLTKSTSPYILISGGTMWSDYITDGKDSWGTWDTEGREQIFKWIDEKKDSKVILLSGDRHGARGFAMPRPDGGKIHEFEVGTLGGVPGPPPFGKDQSAQLFGLPSNSWAFGEFTFSKKDDRPHAVFRLINEEGKTLHTVPLEV